MFLGSQELKNSVLAFKTMHVRLVCQDQNIFLDLPWYTSLFTWSGKTAVTFKTNNAILKSFII